MYNNKKIFILGMARSGFAAAKLLSEHNCDILITDMKEQDEKDVKELNDLGVKVVITDKPEELLDNTYDYVVKNPGIRNDHKVCLKANELNIKIINEVELAYSYFPKVSIIGITGSNGKTTTTTLIYNILKESKKPVYLGGNIGYPVCSLVDKLKDGDILVLEISSHQLVNMTNFKTDISILTNLSEVHLDFFGNFENYMNNKLRIFNNHTNKDIAIYNIGDTNVVNKIRGIKSNKIKFTSKKIKSDLYLKDNAIYYNNELIIKTNDIKVKGNHNYENIMCAIAAVKQYNVSNEVICKVVNTFNGVEHRMEYVKTINNREFYNDSKSTNVKSTITALSAFDKNTIIILGGLDRGHTFEELKDYMNNVSYVISFGETNKRIKDFCNSINIKCIVCDVLKEAVKEAYKVSTDNSVILLSPACASWDQYDHFEQRGDEFKELVNKLN